MAYFPTTLTAKMAFWLHQDDIAALGTRAQWADRQGGRTCTTTGTNPVSQAGPDSTRKSFLFDGGSFVYNLNLTAVTNSEIWLLIKGVAGNQAGFRFGTSGSASHYPFSDGNVYDDTASNGRISFNHAGLANTWNVLRIAVTNTTKQYWINGTSFGTFASNPAQYRTDALIGGPNAATGAAIAEALIFNASLTTTEATNLLAYLQNPLDQMSDTFAGAGTLNLGGTNITAAVSVAAFTLETSEPGAGTSSGWLKFVAPTTARYVIDTSTSSSDTVLEVYTGSAITSLTNVITASSGKAYFSGTAGTTYYIRVALESGSAGSYITRLDYDNRWRTVAKADGAISMWTFEDDPTQTSVADQSGNVRNATLSQNYPWLRSLKRHLSSFAGAFRGNNGDYATGPGYTWPTSGFITLEYCVFWGNRGKQMMWLSMVGGNLDIIYQTSSPPAFGLNNLAGSYHGPAMPAGEYWHHVVYVIPINASSAGQKCYIDGLLASGTLLGVAMTVPTIGSASLRVGHNTGGYEVGAETLMTGVAAYPFELTSTQAKNHYQAAFGYFTDLFQDAMPIVPPGGGAPLPPLDTTSWTTETSEPLTNVATRTGWAIFEAPDSDTYQLDTIGSSYDTSAAVFTGSAIGSLTLVAADSSSGGSSNAKVTFTATAGTRYYLQIGASPGASPDFGTITPHFLKVVSPGVMSTAAAVASTPNTAAFMLKGRSTRTLDSLPGG